MYSSCPPLFCGFFTSPIAGILICGLLPGSAGVGAVDVAAAGSGVLRGSVDAVSGAAIAVGDVCALASTLLKLLHDHMFPDEGKRPEGLDSLVAAFGPDGDQLEGLVRENVVSGLATSIVVLLGHGLPIEDSMVDTLPDYRDEQSARATVTAQISQKLEFLFSV